MGIPALGFKLPEQEEINKSVKKYGYWRTFLNAFLRYLPYLIFGIVVIIFQYNDGNKFKDIDQKIGNINQTIINFDNRSGTASENPILPTGSGNTLSASQGFNPEDWIIEKFEKDAEDYYCPLSLRDFKYWSIWSKEKISPTAPFKIRLKVKNKPSSGSPPTIIISHGEYLKNKTLITDYRINIFDTDEKSIRLYNEKNESVKQAWLKELPNLDNEMIFSLSPRSTSPMGRKLNLNPGLIYNPIGSDSPIEFKPEVEFVALLPTVDIEDKGLKKQLGIGVKFGSCIKINSVEF